MGISPIKLRAMKKYILKYKQHFKLCLAEEIGFMHGRIEDKIFSSIILLILILPLFSSCKSEDFPSGKNLTELTINMDIEGKGRVGTRFVRTEIDDKWTITDFTAGDKMGFYASGGNWLDQNSHIFNNQELIYKGEDQFNTPNGEGNFSPSDMKGNEVYMYFPYCEVMNTDGLELRVNEEGSIRCRDYLSANNLTMEGMQGNKPVALYGTFTHAFAELIIMRGEGFDNPPHNTDQIDYNRITAVINNGYTHIKVNLDTENGWSCVPELFYNSNNRNNLKEDQADRWNAWKGGNYGITTEDPVGREAWYVIVPTLGTSGTGRSIVDYIELYDNEGNLQRVSSLKLSGANTSNPTKYVDSGWRYPMEITMKELVPTVNPFPISRWNETVDLSYTRVYGINNITDFELWVYDYNAYLRDKTEENEKQLLQYGDKTINQDTEEVTWEFYILADLDLTGYQPPHSDESSSNEETFIIPVLENATLDGQSTILSDGEFQNYKITGLNKTFIGNMKNSRLQNIDFISPEVKQDDNTSAGAIIISEMVNSDILNCNIENGTLFNPKGPGGFVAGSISGGSVTDCVLEGTLIATSTAAGEAALIIGTNPQNGTVFKNNNTSGINEELN